MKRLRIIIFGFLWLPTLLTACSRPSSADEVKKELQTINSWATTAHMVGEAWRKGNVPTPYAKTTLQKAQKELHKEADTLEKKASGKEQEILLKHLQNLDQLISQISKAVEQKDYNAIAQPLQELATEEQAVSALAKASEQP